MTAESKAEWKTVPRQHNRKERQSEISPVAQEPSRPFRVMEIKSQSREEIKLQWGRMGQKVKKRDAVRSGTKGATVEGGYK